MLSAMSSTVHVMRHGEVENPQKILYGRQPGWRLSSRGQEMAEVLGRWSKSIDLGALHVSPLQRAQETAAPIAKAPAPKPVSKKQVHHKARRHQAVARKKTVAKKAVKKAAPKKASKRRRR